MIIRLILSAVFLGITLTDRAQADDEGAPHVRYAGGDGSSLQNAVIVKGATEATGIRAEHAWLARKFGGYKMERQALTSQGKRHYDVLEIITIDGEKRSVYFDITDFFGK